MEHGHSKDQDQEVTRQVSGGLGVDANSVDMPRSLSPVSACSSCYNDDIHETKVNDIYITRIAELERALREARVDIPRSKQPIVLSRVNDEKEERDTIVVNGENVRPINTTTRARQPTVMAPIDLPKVELLTFSGEIGHYWKFIRQFENFVECKVTDPGQRFLYLMHYCRGKAREAIEECIMLPNELSYDRAREILKDLYGQPHHVARTLIDNMLSEAKRSRCDADSLARLVVKMQNCAIALTQMNYEADLNALYTLESVVRCLPLEMQHKWAEEAEIISRKGREPKFDELVSFIRVRAKVVNSRFGLLAATSVKEAKQVAKDKPAEPRGPKFSSNFAVTNTRTNHECVLCRQAHPLGQCERFIAMAVTDRWATAKKVGACFSCLNTSHRATECRRQVRCGENGCNRNHHVLLHCETVTEKPEPARPAQCLLSTSQHKPARLGMITVGVVTPNGVVPALAFLDNGSDTTLVSEAFTQRHRLATKPAPLAISTVNGTQVGNAGRLILQLTSLETDETLTPTEAYTVPDLPMRAADSVRTMADEWPHLRTVPFVELGKTEVDVLIGCDVPEAHWVLDQRLGGRTEPYAARTVFGWILFGPLGSRRQGRLSVNCITSEGRMIEDSLRRMYDTEFSDTTEEGKGPSIEDREALTIVRQGTRFEDGRFTVPLPWKAGARALPDNRLMAEKRLSYLKRRLDGDSELLSRYVETMRNTIKAGYAEQVTKGDRSVKPVWYLPHHPVFNPRKPEKTRVVFDCAARYQGLSLNDRLLQGPDWTTPLVEVLCRFRLGQVAVSADIKEMFMQVRVPQHDRDVLRFLWWKDGDTSRPAEVYRFTVHPFGAVSSPFCANFALRAAINRSSDQTQSDPPFDPCDCFYVDDFLRSFDSESEATESIHQTTKILSASGFQLTKWLSNSRLVLASIPEDQRAGSVREVVHFPLPTERMLGVQWDAEADRFILRFELPVKEITRRGMLSSISSLYDPLGFVAPWLLPGKVLLQRLCRQQQGWDTPLNDTDQRDWTQWMASLAALGELSLDRAIPQHRGPGESELHIFADASEEGYGAVAYGCWTEAGERSIGLLFAKARVAPIKIVTIPRLELTAAVLAVKVAKLLRRCYNRTQWQIHFWTDSAIVLHYINNQKTRFSTFVANRLAMIHEDTCPQQWRHVRSEQNPADFCSRGQTNLRNMQTWLHGPAFLTLPEPQWPRGVVNDVDPEQIECKRLTVSMTMTRETGVLEKLNRFGHWVTVLRAVCWWSRFRDYLRILAGRGANISLRVGPVIRDELGEAEIVVLRLLQERHYPDELEGLASTDEQTRVRTLKRSRLRNLHPVVIGQLLRIGGRLSDSDLNYDARHPIIVPPKHHITTLIVHHLHTREGHAGVEHIWNVLRQRFWIVRGKEWVRRLISSCAFCRRQNAVAETQIMADLPAIRTQTGWRPFAVTGIDYFGPLSVRTRRGTEKRYGCLMTCMQSRAIHLEVAHSMTTDSFLMVLQRFVGRRGFPNTIISDNGSNFVGAHNELRRWLSGMDRRMLVTRTAPHGVDWQFNPPYASHRGGVWERMIRSVRRVITAIGGQQLLDDETLSTVLVEAERIVNNRPLVPAPADSNKPALTPNDLVQLHNNPGIAVPRLATNTIHQGWRQANLMARMFWKRWTSEYLPTLQRRQRWLTERRPLRVGDVVLVIEDNVSKDRWPLGVVEECLTSADGRVRTVTVRTRDGDVTRDVRRICFLEGDGDEAEGELNSSDIEQQESIGRGSVEERRKSGPRVGEGCAVGNGDCLWPTSQTPRDRSNDDIEAAN